MIIDFYTSTCLMSWHVIGLSCDCLLECICIKIFFMTILLDYLLTEGLISLVSNSDSDLFFWCRQISLDCMFLQSQHIIDYSLLLGLHFRAPENLKALVEPPRLLQPQYLPPGDGKLESNLFIL